jgi:hypothetical protein
MTYSSYLTIFLRGVYLRKLTRESTDLSCYSPSACNISRSYQRWVTLPEVWLAYVVTGEQYNSFSLLMVMLSQS